MAPGVIARLPNEAPRFVPLALEMLSCGVVDVASKIRDALADVFGWDGDDDVRVLYQEKDLDGESTASAFLKALGMGQPCIIRVLFRLLGGKGGFGALLRKQMGMGKKTTNFDAMRDLSGRRLRHSKAVDRIKEWMEGKKRDDELVNLLTGEGPELPKPTPESESLDPTFLARLKRAAVNQPALVREGMRKLEAEGIAAASAGGTAQLEQTTKRQRQSEAHGGGGSLAAGWFNALESLGTVSSPEPDSDETGKDPKAAIVEKPAEQSEPAAAFEVASQVVRCSRGHVCERMTENPAEPGYDEPACCDVCEVENLPGTCSHFYHCTACEFDVCPPCAAKLPSGQSAGCPAGASASAAATSAASSTAPPAATVGSPHGPKEAAAALVQGQPEAARSAAVAVPEAPAEAAAASTGPGPPAAAATAETAAAEPPDDTIIRREDLSKYASAEEMADQVPPEVLKRSLQRRGLKCGGTVEERAARLFLLKTMNLADLPKSARATPKA